MPAVDIKHFHLGACPCCGSDTACTRGTVTESGERVASYLVKCTPGKPSHRMGWLVSLPDPDSGREVSVSLTYCFEHRSFMVRCRGDIKWNATELTGFGELLDRDQVIGTPLAEWLFKVVDDIWLSDPYVRDFVASAGEECRDVEPND